MINNSTAVFLVQDNVRAMRGKYATKEASELFKTFDPSVTVGDLVVVNTDNRHGFTVVKITEADVDFDIDSKKEIRWIVKRIDITAFEKLLADEAKLIDKVLLIKLNRKRKEMREALLGDEITEFDALRIVNATDRDAAKQAKPLAEPDYGGAYIPKEQRPKD